jgi:hypothetical protein
MNPWIEFLLEVEEMREYQRAFFKAKGKDKVLLAKSKLCEMKVDQLAGKLKESAKQKGITLTKPINHESSTQ